jgi:hypothetical protein
MSQLNIGNLDRALRILLGLVLIGLAVSGTIGLWGYLGVVLVLTGAVALCPLYKLLGISTTAR